ncbi:hypothetical protein [Deinococcus sp. Leaf326]|uniref:hypothetical protein n=1 Tax=Deinococcus sp. Leaf326 TaxID=1736338 RepID=UPI000A8D6F80|nr:hypothetical protein [Deinococcus sp. Leaf326]
MWVVLSIVFFGGMIGLFVFFHDALTGTDAAKAAAALQAIFAYGAIFPAGAVLLVAIQSETRASKAEARVIASEAETERVRQAALEQSAATYELAQATREQAALMRAQESRNLAPNLALVHTGGTGAYAKFTFINLSTQTMFIQEAVAIDPQLQSRLMPVHSETKLRTNTTRETKVLLSGEQTPTKLNNTRPTSTEEAENLLRVGVTLSELITTVIVRFLHAPSGSQVLVKTFRVSFPGFEDTAIPIIEEII